MIQTAPQMRVLLAPEPVDFRKGIDGLEPGVPDCLCGRSLLRLCLCLSQPQSRCPQDIDVRWPGVLAVPEAVIRGGISGTGRKVALREPWNLQPTSSPY